MEIIPLLCHVYIVQAWAEYMQHIDGCRWHEIGRIILLKFLPSSIDFPSAKFFRGPPETHCEVSGPRPVLET